MRRNKKGIISAVIFILLFTVSCSSVSNMNTESKEDADVTVERVLNSLIEGDYEYFSNNVIYYTTDVLIGPGVKNNDENELMDQILSKMTFKIIEEKDNVTTVEITNKDLTTLSTDFEQAIFDPAINEADNPLLAYITSINNYKTVVLDIKTELVNEKTKVVIDRSFIDAVLGGLPKQYS